YGFDIESLQRSQEATISSQNDNILALILSISSMTLGVLRIDDILVLILSISSTTLGDFNS
ncbi:unnamed protein product, partial [marine sediment metagenome]